MLETKIGQLEAASAELQGQMAASAGLIKALAEQNTQLILGVQTLSIRIRWLAGAFAVTVLATAAGLALALMN